jgi:hypothetical protein
MRAAVVTTLRGARATIRSFVRHHLSLGFARIYLFFDDPADETRAVADALADERIASIANDAALLGEWRRCAQFPYYERHIASEVMARQCLNVEVAVQRALDDGIEWLLHIDADELFHAPGQDAPTHFARLSAAGIERAVYPNLEALPEREAIADCFREVTLFKTNAILLPGGRFDAAQQAKVASVPAFASQFFLFYSNGKAAAKVRPGLVPDGVHRFHRTRYPRPGQEAIAAGPPPVERVSGDCRVLHYACCGLDAFADKYRVLGRFDDRWFGSVDIRRAIGEFHTAARDVVATGDEAAIRTFYRERAMLDDRDKIDALIAAGVLQRIDGPARALS